jgi:hypothetical protein
MKINAGTWIGLIGAIIGLVAGIVAVLMTAGTMGNCIALVMLVLFGTMFYMFYRLFFKPMLNASRLLKTGLPGTARITAVNDTGITINNNPQVKLTVEIKNSFGQRYTATIRTLVSRINPFVYQPGMEIPVKIDPKNEQNVVIDPAGGQATAPAAGSFTPANEAALKTELEQLQKENDTISLSGRKARAIIKKYTWLGVNVNGNNPYVELEVEVLPEHSTSFGGKARGVISEAAVQKYQPGCEIFVKYDLYDNSRVVIDHSATA